MSSLASHHHTLLDFLSVVINNSLEVVSLFLSSPSQLLLDHTLESHRNRGFRSSQDPYIVGTNKVCALYILKRQRLGQLLLLV